MNNVVNIADLRKKKVEEQEDDILSDAKRYIIEDLHWMEAQEDCHGYEILSA